MKKTTTEVDERGLDRAMLVQSRLMVMKDGQSFMISRYIDSNSVLTDKVHYLANTRVKMLL
ncbi:MAG: hypothetical protein QMC02_11340 [Halioglobus sp.]|jgi:hypothetical protein